jgi:hypothetical protein
MTTDTVLDRAADFVWRNARLLERRRFAFLFGGGSPEPVVAALRAYRNVDGGFGNALEPDKRCPDSQPVDVQVALQVLDEAGEDDGLAATACDFLETITTPEGGVPFALPTVRDYPRAPWWDAPDEPPASLNPTAALAGLLHKRNVRHPWLDAATAFCWRRIGENDPALRDAHALLCLVPFLAHVPDRGRAEDTLERVIRPLLAGDAGIVADPDAPGYGQTPLAFAPTPDSPFRASSATPSSFATSTPW